uniref:Uncharacterized protein n=1 Tax=Rhizophora mucronata TaxID=61149 RepID=A0A2P2P6E7_RHIMU
MAAWRQSSDEKSKRKRSWKPIGA